MLPFLDSDGGDGTFLVRDSNSSSGDYVLSVLFNDEVIHYQIRKHEDDAFFSIGSYYLCVFIKFISKNFNAHLIISDEQTISHGLETLIEYYQEPNRGLVTALRNPIIKDAPPHDTRRHGRTNLLHRATKEGMYIFLQDSQHQY